MVQDTLMSDSLDASEDSIESFSRKISYGQNHVSIAHVKEALTNMQGCPAQLVLVMKRLEGKFFLFLGHSLIRVR